MMSIAQARVATYGNTPTNAIQLYEAREVLRCEAIVRLATIQCIDQRRDWTEYDACAVYLDGHAVWS